MRPIVGKRRYKEPYDYHRFFIICLIASFILTPITMAIFRVIIPKKKTVVVTKEPAIVYVYEEKEDEKLLGLLSFYAVKSGCSKQDVKPIVDALLLAGKVTKIDPILLLVLMESESECKPNAISSKGYKGLMQTPTATMEFLDVDILHGAKILRQKLDTVNGDVHKALVLYTGGANAVDRTYGRWLEIRK